MRRSATAVICAVAALLTAPLALGAHWRLPFATTALVQDEGDARIVADFQTRVAAYAALHQKLEGTLGEFPRGKPPEVVFAHQRALEALIVRDRASARQGDIFTEPIRAYFRRQLSRVFSGADGPAILDSIRDEDTRAVRLTVNARYPDTLPRSTVPVQVLLVLPRLPEELEYRFVATRLALLDVHADVVVDFMEQAVPR